ncbi:MAG: macrolide ABC transporter ATP-binding protein [Candidatus Levybacteria bacterium RIFCSPHIGHO2_01_FULL_37_17]|nr:MAG: macrolide ABC transporter ATP-binding protein [Candidatus Levybacteria bacterium RIFCSPHIGHO2_01_FULL_37_17]OGH36751.1 MAG: macrolide ABC transporter ATP-binding protein [Candidatus Levybacteria bacterium RIFCSPLOWO2_01_FULL_38_23]
MPNNDYIIEIKDVTKIYKADGVETIALNGINLKLKRGDFLAITGRSGSGKSTLMHIIGLLDKPTSGVYFLNGTDVSKFDEDKLALLRNKSLGFVFQSFNLLQRTTAVENVCLPAVYAGIPENERMQKARVLLDELGLLEQSNKKPNQMSGGQQQRVAIARALINDPSIILADEPTGNLDTKSGKDVMKILKSLNKNGKTIILITHEQDIAMQAKKILHLEDGKIN